MTPTDEARIEEAARAMYRAIETDDDHVTWLDDEPGDFTEVTVDGNVDFIRLAKAALAPTLTELADMTAKVERLEREIESLYQDAAGENI